MYSREWAIRSLCRDQIHGRNKVLCAKNETKVERYAPECLLFFTFLPGTPWPNPGPADKTAKLVTILPPVSIVELFKKDRLPIIVISFSPFQISTQNCINAIVVDCLDGLMTISKLLIGKQY